MAAGLFVAFALTDWLDGFIARKTNTISDLGKYLDPFADKVLVVSAMVAMAYFHLLPLWGVLIILIREMAIMLVRIVAMKKKVISASWPAKIKTFLQMTAVVFVLLNWPYGLEIFWVSVFIAVYSFLEYLWVNRKLFN